MFSFIYQGAPPRIHIPLFTASIKAGFPSPAADYSEEGLDFNELLVKHKSATYCLRVSGDSMTGAGIFPGDILVADRSLQPTNEDIVVAAINGEFTVKRLLKRFNAIILHPENPDHADIHVSPEEDFLIFGVVTSVIRQFKR